jgi:cell division protein FtsQ
LLLKNRRERHSGRRHKQRAAYRHDEKLWLFIKRGLMGLLIFISILAIMLFIKLSVHSFRIKNILVSGNYHLDDIEIKNTVGDGEDLLRLSFDELESRIKEIAWVKGVSIRKQFPHTLMVHIEEADPRALLKFDGHMYLISSEGKILEELKEISASFLPVINGINPYKDRGGVLEALKLIDALDEKNILSTKDSIEITLKPFGLLMKMDGEPVKVGYGRYSEKLQRWKEIEPEIRRRNIIIDYVDLRFKDKVIVRPLKKGKKIKETEL